MADEKIYSQDELDKAVWDALSNRAKVEFEEDTRAVLRQINKRLDEANNYKATIGKDVKSLKERAERQDAESQKRRQDARDQHQWYQDKWIRVGIAVGICWELINVLQGLGLIHPIHFNGL